MAGNKEGAAKAKARILSNNPNFYREVGSLGGKKITEKTKNKGFASMSPERRSELGRIGGSRGKQRELQANKTN